MRIPIAIIVDNLTILKWQQSSLNHIRDLVDVKIILNNKNTYYKKNYFKNFLYYILNILCIKNYLNIKKSINLFNKCKLINFETKSSGIYQEIPNETLKCIAENNIKLIIKFGMNLIKINENYKFDIISFHHGDPEYFRGRPSCFYEILYKSQSVSAIVQILNNNIDKGQVLERISSKIFLFSYKKTLINLYSKSPYLLRKSIINWLDNKSLDVTKFGKLYKLPSNFIVSKFIFQLIIQKFRRLIDIIFFEKKWSISFKDRFNFSKINSLTNENSKEITYDKKKYAFISDPFISYDNNNIYLEAFNKRNNLGEILIYNISTNSFSNILTDNHYSYPNTISYNKKNYLFPETAFHSKPFFIDLSSDNKIFLKGFEDMRIVDATYFYHDKIHFIFYGLANSSLDTLYLSFSENFLGPYQPHPLNPIILNPNCARMAGNIIEFENNLFRFGQDNTGLYGNGIIVNKIKFLSSLKYTEEFFTTIKFKNFYGPHTINLNDNRLVFDFYKKNFNLFILKQKIKSYLQLKNLSTLNK